VSSDSEARTPTSGVDVRFAALNSEKPGVLVLLLERVYAPLLDRDPQVWSPQRLQWQKFDAAAFGHLDTIGSCTFLTRHGEHLVGFASYDPRQRPDVGIIGHNCVVPQFQRQGIGKAQIHETLRRLRAMGIRRARVATLDLPFFTPARRMYMACGFTETGRTPWDCDPTTVVVEYERILDR
jgi:GNAT superfamily N-acetyltransferase